ncbi:mitochondrial 39-S ribosomal protein L47 (MRP-L47)-domain-containing protein [Microdochium trichocladiopsis]|uniref:Large ribosomal subunit protein uL29m n=1 Tax=Microdochium trichocladiopsis TaxID=1682393 RepID=A0A9P8Y4E5_9PEZI|nr:mitochondrial 39-S ribosomal protein L47 (MRP-L47)-domain-containing protein [Microdochium trichocladiopsis]KAH7030982.1 mitochondrial 39-S ribosomal protein L47 (MRP-L47)-domain-containing protein [Microdochium trichocladiopsis]
MASPSIVRPVLGRAITASSTHSSCHGPATALGMSRTTAGRLVQQQPRSHKCFSTTPELNERRTRRDNNKKRGLSSVYGGSKPSHRMQIQPDELPLPVQGFKPKVKTDPDHGLWDFFYANKQRLIKPDEIAAHGRAWTVEELRHKSWEDLHRLWWTCVKERNRLMTMAVEYEKAEYTVGKDDMEERDVQVKKTMKHIKHALTERYYLWEDARALAESDPEIDLNSAANPYVPTDYMEPEPPAIEVAEEQAEVKAAKPSTIPAQAGEAKQETRV